MKNLAIIPARSGSKGLPDKNIKPLNNKPLLSYSIEAALKSGCFNEVMVSTDSPHYAEIAKNYGASVPFLRSEATSSDTASSWDMVEEVLNNYQKLGKSFDTFCLLQPTSPLRTAEDIRAAYGIYKEKASFAVVSVCETEHSPLWAGQLPENCEFVNFIDSNSPKRRQDAGKFYRINGAIYIANVAKFKTDKFLYTKGSFAYIMPQERSIDIDTELDFKIAEAILSPNIIQVAFDTNTYQRVLCPYPEDPKYQSALKIYQLIRDRQIQGFLSETIFTLEAKSGRERVAFFANYDPTFNVTISQIDETGHATPIRHYTEGGTTQPPRHDDNSYFKLYWNLAKNSGFKLLSCPRIAEVKDSTFKDEDYALCPKNWNDILGECVREIEEHGCGKRVIEGIGNQYRQNNETWFEGLKHLLETNDDSAIRRASEAIAEWADADSIAACQGYSIQYFCTEDHGGAAGISSILHPDNRQWFNNKYDLKIVTMDELLTVF